MSKNERLFRIIAVTALGLSVYSVIRREAEIKAINETYSLISKYITEQRFAEIVEHYNDNDTGDDK